MLKSEYKTHILNMLGGSVVDIELEDDIGKFIDLALFKVQPYINSTKFMTLPLQPVIDLKNKGVYSVTTVYSGAIPVNTGVSSSLTDGSLLFGTSYANAFDPMIGIGSVDSIAISLLTNQVITTATGSSTEIDFIYKDRKLYVNQVNLSATEITIEYVPMYEFVDDVTDPYWCHYILNIAIALTKIALGRARGKYRISNLSYEMDSDTLISEGNTELETLMNELRESNDTFYILD